GVAPIFYRYSKNHEGLLATIEALCIALDQPEGSAIEGPPSTPTISLVNDDPVREKFGTEPEKDGWRLSGEVKCTDNPDWFAFRLTVEATDATRRLANVDVVFFLHPTFAPSEVRVPVTNRIARYDGRAYGAFTVGALVGGVTKLGLDLSTLSEAPDEFKVR
ncbi:MAG TPA: pYEATS domain-containing protein, partial [Chthoniobacterales bacterium]|nr:pYEATS domain-containing protein [Chthoniobacterales bacterium]